MPGESAEWEEISVNVAGTDLTFIQAGAGRPLLVLHGELGHPGWLNWHRELARNHKLYVPLHPGFGVSPRVEWVSNIRDLAGFYSHVLTDMELGPVDVIGFSLGGWIAAEMAAARPQLFRRMALVGAMGIRPTEGEIRDLFIVPAQVYLGDSVHDADNTEEFSSLYGGGATPEQFEAWEDARTEVSRLAWKPYMHNPSLGPLLEGVRDLPTLLVWGSQDKIAPISAGQVYNRSIAGSELISFEECGHRPEIEKPREFVEAVGKFLGS